MKLGKISGVLALSGLSATSALGQSTTPTLPTTLPASADRFYNLALGSSALGHLQTYNAGIGKPNCSFQEGNWTGCFNTAIGSSALLANTLGHENVAIGAYALTANTSGHYNTAIGNYSLAANTSGYSNTGVGVGTLNFNTGNFNSGIGSYALWRNTTGNSNTALGYYALLRYQTPSNNTALGALAMEGNFTGSGTSKDFSINTGSGDTAVGSQTLTVNTSGSNLTALGYLALSSNTTGSANVAEGYAALEGNISGSNNTATGTSALTANTTGPYNSAFGYQALYKSQSGFANIGMGPFAGQNIVQGQLNIDIGSWGSADESNTIRIGLPGYHLATFISGIATTHLTGAQVVVTPAGQLGVLASSERYKTDIKALASATDNLSQLRAVSFHLKSEPAGQIQYGLIAEEVQKIYPELVIRDDAGQIQGIRYDELAPMLLNEFQKQQAAMLTLSKRNDAQAAKITDLEQQLQKVNALEEELKSALEAVRASEKLLAQR